MANYTIEEIKELVDNDKWIEADKAAVNLLDENSEDDKLLILYSKIFLFNNSVYFMEKMNFGDSSIPPDDEVFDYYLAICRKAVHLGEIVSNQKAYENFKGILDEFYDWEKIIYNCYMNIIIKNPARVKQEHDLLPFNLEYKLIKMELKMRTRCMFEIHERDVEMDDRYLNDENMPDFVSIRSATVADWIEIMMDYYYNNYNYKSEIFRNKFFDYDFLIDLTINKTIDSLECDIRNYKFNDVEQVEEPNIELYIILLKIQISYYMFILDAVYRAVDYSDFNGAMGNKVRIDNPYTSMIIGYVQRKKYIEKIHATIEKIKEYEPEYSLSEEIPSVEGTKANFDLLQNKSSDGCYVATAVYGSYDCPEVWTLRRYRDNMLSKTWHGRTFIYLYYAISPTIVKWFGNAAWFKNIWRSKLDKMVQELQNDGVESTPYEDKNWRKEK